MNSRGEVRLLWVIAVVVVIYVVLSLFGFSPLQAAIRYAKLLPVFDSTPPPGTSIVGINLVKQDLRYFTGDTWKVIDDKKSVFAMGE